MKKYIFLSIAILLTLVGCENFLDTKDLLNKNDQNFPEKEEDLQSSLAAIYQCMPAEQWGVFFYSTIVSDDVFGGGGPDDFNSVANDRLKKSNENMMTSVWTNYYKGIFRANKLLENIDNVDKVSPATKQQVLGEAYYMRAWFNFSLGQLFGGIPLFTKAENVIKPKASPEELYGQIANDLKTAIELFPSTNITASTNNQLGHANKWAAEALLALVYLFYTGYYQKTELPLAGGGSITKSQVVAYLDDCINNSGYALAKDFRELWPYTNKYTVDDYPFVAGQNLKWLGEEGLNRETVFEIRYGNFGDYGNSSHNEINIAFGLRGQSKSNANTFPFGGGWGQGTVNSRMVEQWEQEEPGDPRIKMSLYSVDDPAEGIVKYEENGWSQMNDTHLFIKKYTAIMAWKKKSTKTVYASYTVPLYGAADAAYIRESQSVVLIRFSDVLLMHSELTESNTGLNHVRSRVGLAPIGYSLEALQKERRHELAFEGVRYFDLLRWYRKDAGKILQDNQNGVAVLNANVPGTMSFDLVERVNATGGFWPIPNSEIMLSNGILEQNPGWGADAQ